VTTTGQETVPTTGYVLYVLLESGDEIRTASDGSSQALDELQRQLESDEFVRLGDDLVVRTGDVHSAHRRRDDGDGHSLVDSLKQRLRGDDMAATERPTRPRGGTAGIEDRYLGYGTRPWAETKPFFLTSEFFTWILVGAGILIAAAIADNLDAPRAWLLLTILTAAYIVSRGLAKAGSRDPNPELFDPERNRR
jgi:hypothetical protein